MKITKSKLAAATFGAALTSLYSAPELNGQIININFAQDTVAFSGGPASAASITPIDFTNVVSGSYGIPGVANGAVGVFNNSTYGVDLFANFFTGFDGWLVGLAVAQPGDFFTAGETTYGINFDESETGIRYIGFLAGGSVGWFSVDLGDTPNDGSDLVFTGGQFLVGGGPGITVGVSEPSSAVPEPSSAGLAALALGAIGLRRRRKAAA